MEFLGSQLLGLVLGLAAGLMAPEVLRRWRVARSGLATRSDTVPELRSYSPESEDICEINSWSAGRPLTRSDLSTTYLNEQPPQTWLTQSVIDESRKAFADGGRSYYLVDYAIDDRESDKTRKFEVTLAPSCFGDYRAALASLLADPSAVERIARLARTPEGVRGIVRSAPPSVIGVHVNVLSADRRLLIVKRSNAVGEHQGQFQFGAGETMTRNETPGAREDFFALAGRALREEVDLTSQDGDFTPILISWFGLRVRSASPLVIAHVASRLSHHELELKLEASEGWYEHASIRWESLDAPNVRRLVREIQGQPDGWVPASMLVLRELWRVRHMLRAPS
jgi:hypothetical protein